MTAPTEDLIERADMIVAELQGLPHVTETVREVSDRLRSLQAEVGRLSGADARLHAITREGKCPHCELTKAQCADIIAEIEIGRRSALNTGSGEG